jgi:N-acetylglucosaminyl-diphospho-decaprenol L-rhamnosyltransferase
MRLLIVVINYRTPELTIDALESIASQVREVDAHVVLVDNASGDDSLPRLTAAIEERGWRSWVELIASPVNTGFAGGNNLVLCNLDRYPDARFVLLLNSDTISDPGVLAHCVAKMEADPGIGVMSCLLLNADRSVQNTARRFLTPSRLLAHTFGLPWYMPRLFAWADTEDPAWDRRTEARDVDWVGGAFMMIRREVIERVGALDDAFFFYGEDAEFCHRVTQAGWRVRYEPGAAVIHLGGASSDPARLAARQRSALQWQARYLFQRRCYGRLAEWSARSADLTSGGLRCLKMAATGQRQSDKFALQRDVLELLLQWPSALAPRD